MTRKGLGEIPEKKKKTGESGLGGQGEVDLHGAFGLDADLLHCFLRRLEGHPIEAGSVAIVFA